MLKFVICLNQVSYLIASEMRRGPHRTYLIVDSERIRAPRAERTYELTGLVLVCMLVCSLLSSRVQVVVPHGRHRPLFRLLLRCARNLALIDDGLDTYRDTPRNIELSRFPAGIDYYTFDSPVPKAAWLSRFRVVAVCPMARLGDDRPSRELKNFNRLAIESPGLPDASAWTGGPRTFVITHPNRNKNRAMGEQVAHESGRLISAERTAAAFKGDILIGETMVLVYLLAIGKALHRIHVYLAADQYGNLSCLHPILEECGALHLTCPPAGSMTRAR